ncbi:UBAP2 family protein [Megaselia abdita]
MSTQTRSSGGGRNNNKKANSSGGGGNNNNANNTANVDVATSAITLKSSSTSANSTTDKDGGKPQQQQQQTVVKAIQPTAEQMRIAQITDMNSGYEDSDMKNKVATLIDMTKRSESDVCCALNECEFDLQKAAEYLLETLPVNAFEISSKKKKNKPSNSESGAGGNDDSNEDWDNNGNAGGDSRREKSRNRTSNNRGGGGGGRGGNDSRGWRGREARENERNLAESNKFNDRDGQGGGYRGRGRGGYGGRGGYSGGRGGRGGGRGMGPRGGDRDRGARSYSSRQPQDQHQEVDTWDNSYAQSVEQPPQQADEWGDWDNEEYVGSLKDTKVFTPSNMQTTASVVASSIVSGDIGAPPGLGDHQQSDDLLQQQSSQQYSQQVVSSNSVLNPSQFPEIHSANVSASSSIPQVKSSATLSAEQSQYFNSLTSQNAQSHLHQQQQAQVHASVQYPTTYGTVFGDPSSVSSQPRRARAKVPPPSKIPSSAVEMPGDMLNNASYLEDVQFGFGIEESAFVEALSDKFASATAIADSQQPNVQSLQQSQQAADLSGNEYQAKQQIPGIQSNKIPDSLTSGYSQRAPSNVQSTGVAAMNAAATAALEQLTKNDPYGQSNQSNATGGYQTSYNPNVSSNKVSSYQPAGQGYQNNTSYNNSQSSTGSTYPPQPNSYNSYNQNSVNSYQQANSSVSGGNTGNSTQNIPVGGSGVNNSSATANAGGYLSSQYQSNQTSSAFQSQYQNNQSVYGGSAGLSNNTGGSNVSSSVVSSTVSSVSNAGASVTNSNNMNSSSAASSTLANSSTATTGGAGSSSVSSAAAASSNSSKANQSASGSGSGVVQPNIQMVSQYIQAGLPYYQQPVYSYEDITIMQQRMPHVKNRSLQSFSPQTQYFDVNYTPTSLGAAGVRDGNLGSVAYSPMTDGRFARTDNNSSPVSNVSNTMSQQAGSSTPMINVPYAYFYGGNIGNMMPGGFQYHGTPAIYPQQMQTANPTSAGQFPKPSYNSGYGSATSYDSLSQASQDYSKGGYAGTGVNQQPKSQTVSNNPQGGTGSDIASSMYNKAHVALNKVNSYDKQAFHSATPPPFNMSSTQASGTGSTQYGMYIQPMPAAAHHNMNMHQQIHQMDNRIYNQSRRDSNSTGQRQQSSSQSKTGTKQGYSPSYWAGNN